MPVCQRCHIHVDRGSLCPECGSFEIDHTRVDPLVSAVQVAPLRPVSRPPMAKLVIIDDDSDRDGEVIRLRATTTTIGRRECDINLPNDPDISGTHLTIRRVSESNSTTRWVLSDAQSTNGTFVRTPMWRFSSDGIFQIGRTKLSWYHNPGPPQSRRITSRDGIDFQVIDQSSKVITMGRAKDCQISLNDPTANPYHAELRFDGSIWVLKDLSSLNGTWVHVSQIELQNESEILIGQQRMRFAIPALQTQEGAISS